jgi:glycosyltransferase involved in cell wall biosynthesis
MLLQAAPGVGPHGDHTRASNPRVSVVIPTLNEERCIAWVLERLPEFVGEVILVDGRSTDRTFESARSVRRNVRGAPGGLRGRDR